MGALLDQLIGFFGGLGWPIVQVPGQPVLSVTYGGQNGQWVFIATADEDLRLLTMLSRAPFSCPADRRGAMAELMTRLNYRMTHGCFDMDFDDGEIRYRSGVDLAGTEIDDVFLGAMARYNLASMDHYLPALTAVVAGELTPAQAAAKF